MLTFKPHESSDFPSITHRFLSLGAGVQSTTLALMASHGEITPMPDAAIFADTQWEEPETYEHLKWLSSGNVLNFPVYRVTAGDIRDKLREIATAKVVSCSVPLFTLKGGNVGKLKRQCTHRLKIEPLDKEMRRLAGIEPKKRTRKGQPKVEVWIGISLDEVIRAKPSYHNYKVHRFPLLERRMKRSDCLEWMSSRGYPEPPKSACIACPHKSNERWREMKERNPASFAEAVEADEGIRRSAGGKISSELFFHPSCKPLKEIAFTEEETGQPDIFGDECEGMCGV